jgi:homotetrameric cytidine deaminase
MVPRIDLLAFEDSTTLEDATEILLQTGHSRAPVYSGTIDNIVGLVYIKDLLAAWREGDLKRAVSALSREPYFVPEAKKADDLLAEMQAKRVHMAVVVDEYGGTAGLVTIEDIVEEIVGEIRDEYAFAEELAYEQVQEGVFIFSGGIDLDDVNQIADAHIPKETSETLGGFIYSELGKVPSLGESVDAGGLHFVVEEVSGRTRMAIQAETKQRIIERAMSIREKAYAPYSKYRVGASLLTESGDIFDGVNVENAVYSMTVCAERNAVFQAVTHGQKTFQAIAVATDNGGSPCGACRQVMTEFGPDMLVIMLDAKGEIVLETTARELLPDAFGPKDLETG